MNASIDALADFLKADGWTFDRSEGDDVIQVTVTGVNARWSSAGRVHQNCWALVFSSFCPILVPSDRRPAVAEYLMRANWGMALGCFEMDYGDGEIRFKTSVAIKDQPLTAASARQVVYTNFAMMDRYLPGIFALLYGDVTPEQALTACDQRHERTETDDLDISDEAMRVIFEKLMGDDKRQPEGGG
jgi:hypothetical protein